MAERLEKLGIDLGTSNVVVARMVGDNPEVCDLGDIGEGLLIPSYVWIRKEGNIIVGKTAKEEWADGERSIYRRFKLDMGSNKEYEPGITPETLTTCLLKKIMKAFLGDDSVIDDIDRVEEVVVSVPHGWDSMRRAATINSIKNAGLKLKRLISEPVAAAAYYSWHTKKKGRHTILVCDMGGGTFDVSLVEVYEATRIKVIDSTRIDKAGLWADAFIVREIIRHFNDEGLNIACDDVEKDIINSSDPNIRKWLDEAEEIKERLNTFVLQKGSTTKEKNITFKYDKKELLVKFNYEQLVELLNPLIEDWKLLIKSLLLRNKESTPDLVVLAGGMGKMKVVQELVSEATGFGLEGLKNFGIEADRAIAKGAALVVYDLVKIDEVLIHSIGIAAYKPGTRQLANHIIIKKRTPIPFSSISTKDKINFVTTKSGEYPVMVRIVYGEEEDISQCEAYFDFEFKIPDSVGMGTPYDVEFSIDEDGVLKVEVKGIIEEGGKWEGKILKHIPHYLEARPVKQKERRNW